MTRGYINLYFRRSIDRIKKDSFIVTGKTDILQGTYITEHNNVFAAGITYTSGAYQGNSLSVSIQDNNINYKLICMNRNGYNASFVISYWYIE